MDNFEEYLRQGEPDKAEKAKVWKTAVGLQDVDGLKPSDYLIETARQNIEGDITIDEVKQRIDTYYKQHPQKTDESRTEEADKVSARIAEILSEKTFTFSPAEYLSIHRRLFTDVYKFAGKIRDYNITKQEWVLDGETVLYGSAESLKATLEYDFEQEKKFSYKGLCQREVIEHIAHFISYLWQIHVFGEGNTRATAVFLIKYLRTFGFVVNNDLFAEHSWYFRNALVRSVYKNHARNVYATNEFLLRFLENLLLSENHVLRNREMHIQLADPVNDPVKSKNDLVNDPVKSSILNHLKQNPKANYLEMAENIGCSTATIKRHIQELKKLGLIERIGSDKTGQWRLVE
ncbi:MAG TPA: Fic family protein [Bacteroidales bacterium]|nr:Fic family protein [Bacteroidales bacterium]